jgi:uncharacterized protein YndB with AHSA1/START domain
MELHEMTDRIEKTIVLRAPVARVWRALTDHAEFSTWFRVSLERPFAMGEVSRGQLTYPGWEHVTMEVRVVAMEPPERFAFTWHPGAIEPGMDYSEEPPTLVEFRLHASEAGTRLEVVESGFDALPAGRRAEAFRMNERGWAMQMENIRAHVGG